MLTCALDAKELGGRVILGGSPISDKEGYFLQPTVITSQWSYLTLFPTHLLTCLIDMNSKMLTTNEEVFAPVVPLYCFDNEEDAIEQANNCDVGLGSFIMTSSIARSWHVTESLEVG